MPRSIFPIDIILNLKKKMMRRLLSGTAARPPASWTPLLGEIHKRVLVRGPISVADFMQLALQHPTHGYYTSKKVAIGQRGDFITSPEISQLFGELVGVWCVSIWEQLGKPSRLRIVELGGGRGTLLKDAIRAFGSFPRFASALCDIRLVETSDVMRDLQRSSLDVQPSALIRVGKERVKVEWVSEFAEAVAPADRDPVVIIAQELFDALPVHQFEYTELGWCERLVDILTSPPEPPDPNASKAEDDLHLRFVLSKGPTPAAHLLLGELKGEIGERIEVGAAAAALSQRISSTVSRVGGAALIVDYGSDGGVTDSLRGIQAHKFVHPLLRPGAVDLSVDVNFTDLRAAAQAQDPPFANVVGPVSQSDFLRAMGIEHRVAALLRQPGITNEQRVTLFQGYKRLVGAMGTTYQVMAMVSLPDPFAPVAGFPPEALQTQEPLEKGNAKVSGSEENATGGGGNGALPSQPIAPPTTGHANSDLGSIPQNLQWPRDNGGQQ